MQCEHIVFFSKNILLASSQKKRNPSLEFIAGRECARECFIQLSIEPVEVLKNSDGSPCWPKGVCGSISHSHGRAICAMSTVYKSLGIDLQKRVILRRLEAFKKRILVSDEINLFQEEVMNENDFALLCFSIKESVYKCLFPIYKKYLGFHDVQISEIDFQSGHFSISNFEAAGKFYFKDDYIYCLSVMV